MTSYSLPEEPNWNFGSGSHDAPAYSGSKRSDFPDMRKMEDKVPAGHYAVEADGTLKFYLVDKPTQGRWKGYTFIKVQASDEYWPVKAANSRYDVLSRIVAVGPENASKRYGKEIGQCGVCNRTLTDENSRRAGIGPICAGKMGW
jgi:hypothetical protein